MRLIPSESGIQFHALQKYSNCSWCTWASNFIWTWSIQVKWELAGHWQWPGSRCYFWLSSLCQQRQQLTMWDRWDADANRKKKFSNCSAVCRVSPYLLWAFAVYYGVMTSLQHMCATKGSSYYLRHAWVVHFLSQPTLILVINLSELARTWLFLRRYTLSLNGTPYRN